jgi:toxin ParE1/3/4
MTGAPRACRDLHMRWITIRADRSSLGSECSEVRKGYRKYPSGSHVFFYRTTADGIDVIRILHERMDYERHIP